MISTTVQIHNVPFAINREILTIKQWKWLAKTNEILQSLEIVVPSITNLGQPGEHSRLKKCPFSWGIRTHRKFHPSSHRIRPHGIICLSLPGWITVTAGIWWRMRKQCTGCSWYKPLLPTSCRGEATPSTWSPRTSPSTLVFNASSTSRS